MKKIPHPIWNRDDESLHSLQPVCPLCDGSNVQRLAWVDKNNAYVEDGEGLNKRKWCEDCEKLIS